jgi:hypothetical protein
MLGIREIETNRLFRNEAHKAFTGLERRFVDSFGLQAFRGIKFQHIASPHHIDGAHLRHHVGSDETDDLVEFCLCRFGLRHHLPEPSDEDTRAKCEACHYGSFRGSDVF